VPQADFDRELELTLGPMTLGFVRLLSVFVPNIREERGFLKEIDQIKVAVYKIRSMPPLDDFQPPWHLGTQRKKIHTRDVRNATLPDFWEVEQEGFAGGYNRVDGLYAGLILPPARREGSALYGRLLYAFGAESLRYQIGLDVFPLYRGDMRWHGPGSDTMLSLGGEVHNLTDTEDDWIISEEENTLSSVLLRRDFRDYFRRSGWSAHVAHDLGGIVRVSGRIMQDDFHSLENSVNWSVFDNKWARDSFRPNPAIDEVRINSLRAELELDTRNSRVFPGRGWYARTLLEKGGAS